MASSTTNKSLIWIIVFLILTNLAVLGYFLWFKTPDKRPRGREDFIGSFLQKEIKFDTVQMRAYQNLKSAHMQKVKPMFENVRNAKDTFYDLLYTKDVNDSLVRQKAEIVGNKQRDLDLYMFQHLQIVRALCTPAQVVKFDSSFNKVVSRLIGRSRKTKEVKK